MKKETHLEVLAPAGSMDALVAAVRCGADAVYLGQKNFSARKNSQNFDEETLTEAVAYAHRCGVKIHQALNIVVFEQELDALKECIRAAVHAGVDAMIVQDWGVAELVRRFAPDMPLHASTQMAIHSPAGVRLAKELGFSRVVLSRELTREEIGAIVRSTDLETEIFVHGAHCMSVSGQCYLSAAIGGKSGNRGQCAQPCRLPFTAGTDAAGNGKLTAVGESVLSLKDMDLIPYLPEIEKMGVTSVKIEGRMKRPEYVAAAVTGCRQALRGETPDLDTLRAVFSRSGFSDGYFTGNRDRKMFGFRTKEDVTAAGEVFTRLKGLYHKENPLVPVSMSFSMEPEKEISLTVSDGEHTVQALGEVPFVPAEGSRPADEGYIARSLEKLGGTPYYTDENALRIRLGDNLMIRASSLNALRREAVGKLDAEREKISGRFMDGSLPEMYSRKSSGTAIAPKLWVKLASSEQLTGAILSGADRIILPAHALIDLLKEGKIRDAEKWIPVLPRFTYSEAEGRALLRELSEMGVKTLYCESGAHIELGREAGLTLFGGPYLNLTNPVALQKAAALGLSGAVLSPEGKLSQLTALVRHAEEHFSCGIYAYGRMALMALRNCPVRAQIGCGKCGRKGYLTDRMGIRFPVRCDRLDAEVENAVSYLLNSLPLSMTDKQDGLASFDFALLDFTVESAGEIAQVLGAWKNRAPIANYTRGLYTRGVTG